MKTAAACAMIITTLGVLEDALGGSAFLPIWLCWILVPVWIYATIDFILRWRVVES